MSEKGKKASVDTSHLSHGRYRQDDDEPPQTPGTTGPTSPDDEDWGKEAEGLEDWDEEVTDDDEEPVAVAPPTEVPSASVAEGETSVPQTQESIVTQTAAPNQPNQPNQPNVPAAPAADPVAQMTQMMTQLNEMRNNAVKAVDQQIAEKKKLVEDTNKEIATLEQQRVQIAAWGGGSAPAAAVQPKEDGRRRRGGRRRAAAASDNGSTATQSTRRTRQKNDKTLKETIKDVLGKRGRTDLKTITQDIEATGYKTNSKKFANTVRVQLYRLDDEGEITLYDDGTFALKA